MKRPSFQWYPNDWLAASEIRSCSIAARGLWIDMICLMHQGSPYGHLTINGKVVLPTILARIVGISLSELEGLLAELEEAGVFSRTASDVIYCRRMIRDEDLRQLRAAGGVKSLQNPNVPQRKGILEGGASRIVTPLSIDPSPSSSSSSSSSSSGEELPLDFSPLFLAICEVCVLGDPERLRPLKAHEVMRVEANLKEREATAEMIRAAGQRWKAKDWRGKRGEAPTPNQLVDDWAKLTTKGDSDERLVKYNGKGFYTRKKPNSANAGTSSNLAAQSKHHGDAVGAGAGNGVGGTLGEDDEIILPRPGKLASTFPLGTRITPPDTFRKTTDSGRPDLRGAESESPDDLEPPF